MPRFSPIILNFNGGEVGPLMYGRVDHDKYPSFCETLENFLLSAQGAAIKRPGTIFVAETEEPDFASELIDFRYSTTEQYVLEFGRTHVRFFTNDGLVLEAEKLGTTSSSTVVDLVAHGYSANDYVFVSNIANGAGDTSNHNGKVLKLSGVTANTMTFDEPLDVGAGYSITVARVYRVAHPFTETQIRNLQYVQSGDVLYIVNENKNLRTLTRRGALDWVFALVEFDDGPYGETNSGATDLTLNVSGDLGRKGGVTVTASAGTAADAVDGDISDDWQPGAVPAWVKWDLGAGNTAKIAGYVLAAPVGTGVGTDVAPESWKLEGSADDATWFEVHAGHAIESWTRGELRFFEVQHAVAYRYFRLTLESSLDGTGVRLSWAGLLPRHDFGGEVITVTASNVTDINGGTGFQATDVGRRIRLRSPRGYWVWGHITSRASTTEVNMLLHDLPLSNALRIGTWQLGAHYASNFPNAIGFYQSRQAFVSGAPIRLALTASDDYTNMSPTDPEGVVTDADAINRLLNSRTADGARWMIGTERALLIGLGDAEYVVSSGSNDHALSPTNIVADPATKFGSLAGVRPVETDGSVLFFDKTGALRELAYVFEVDSYKAPDLTLFAHHIFESTPVAMSFQGSPHSVAWAPRADGQIATLTYKREHDVVGWARQILGGVGTAAGGAPVVEKTCSVLNTAGTAEEAWFVVKRYINGATRRYIERTSPFFDDSTEQEDAFFVDCGATYDGAAASIIGNLWHLEGRTGLVAYADGEIFEGLTVTAGKVTFDRTVTKAHIGERIRSVVKTLPIRGGALDGTAQGRTKRIHEIVFDFWRTYGGSYGPDEDNLEELNFTDIVTLVPGDPPPLVTGFMGPFKWPGSYEKEGAICYVHDLPSPCNIRGFMPRMSLEDNG